MQRISRVTIHDLTEREMLILRQETDSKRKRVATTWLLWVFLGLFGAHRFYLGRIGTGFAQLFTLGGLFIWAIIDVFLISGMLKDNERKVQGEVLQEIAAMREARTKTN